MHEDRIDGGNGFIGGPICPNDPKWIDANRARHTARPAMFTVVYHSPPPPPLIDLRWLISDGGSAR